MEYMKGLHGQSRTHSPKSTHVVKVKIIAKDTVKSFYLVNFKTQSPVYPENGRVRTLTSYLSFTDQCLLIPDWSICNVRRIGVNIFFLITVSIRNTSSKANN